MTRKTSREQTLAQKREQILLAAEETFLSRGFHAASMIEIAKRAGVSPPHLYNFYENKAALATAVLHRMNEAAFESIQNALQAESSGKPHTPCLEHLFDKRRTALLLTVLTEASRNPAAESILKEQSKRFIDALRQLHGISADDAVGCARLELSVSMILGTAIRYLFQPEQDAQLLKAMLKEAIAYLATPTAPKG